MNNWRNAGSNSIHQMSSCRSWMTMLELTGRDWKEPILPERKHTRFFLSVCGWKRFAILILCASQASRTETSNHSDLSESDPSLLTSRLGPVSSIDKINIVNLRIMP